MKTERLQVCIDEDQAYPVYSVFVSNAYNCLVTKAKLEKWKKIQASYDKMQSEMKEAIRKGKA